MFILFHDSYFLNSCNPSPLIHNRQLVRVSFKREEEVAPAGCACDNVICICVRMCWPRVVFGTAILVRAVLKLL